MHLKTIDNRQQGEAPLTGEKHEVCSTIASANHLKRVSRVRYSMVHQLGFDRETETIECGVEESIYLSIICLYL